MTETLTESFCERCGTRYTFESAKPRVRLKGVKVLSRGLKNFVLSDDTSMDEAMAAARSETDRESTAHQLDAFHETFNFCMSCRQYTCPNCWNEPEARCLTCAPLALPEEPAVADDLRAFRDALLVAQPASADGTGDHVEPPARAEGEPVATADFEGSVPFEAEVAATLELERAAPAEAERAATLEGQAAVASEDDSAAAPTDPAGKAAAQTAGLLERFRPGQSLDAQLDAFERDRADAAATAATTEAIEPTEPAAAANIEPEHEPQATQPAVVEATSVETVVEPADVPAPETVVEPADVLAVELEPQPEPAPVAAAPADVVEQPTWRISAPDAIGTTAPTPPAGGDAAVPLHASAPTPALSDAEPQWPAQPQWPSATPAAGLPFLGRPAAPQGGIDALWAASNQEVVTAAPAAQGRKAGGIQPCISCGLSLSANARFCRRCGTLQGH